MRNDEHLLLQEASADFTQGYGQAATSLRESDVDWWEGLLHNVLRGRISPHALVDPRLRENVFRDAPFREAMATGDFPLMLLTNTADRALLAGYQEDAAMWRMISRVKVNIDLKDAELYAIDGGEGVMGHVPEQGPYTEASLSETRYQGRVKKYGRKFLFSLEAFLNDGLRAFDSTPARMGRAARRTEEDIMTRLYATDTAIAALITAGNKNRINIANGARTTNPAFSVDGIIDGLTVMSKLVDADGEPIDINGAVVVYPSGQQGAAMHIANMLEVRSTSRGAAPAAADTTQTIVARNPLSGLVTFVSNKRLNILGTSGELSNADTGWWIFANPNIGRPALTAFQLMGQEQPQLFMKAPNAMLVSGGNVSPMNGDFDNDSIAYKIRMWFNGITVDPKSVVYSNGTGA